MKNKVRNPIFAFVLLILLLAAMGALLYYVSTVSTIIKTELRNEMKLEGAVNTINKLSEGIKIDYEREKNKTRNTVKMMCAALKQYVTENGYEGPEIFDGSVVLRVKNNELVYPEGFSAAFSGLEPKDLDNHFHQTEMLKDDGSVPQKYVLAFGQITKDTWFADYTEEEEFFNSSYQLAKMNKLLYDTEKSYGGYIFMIDASDPELPVMYWSDDFGTDQITLSDIGISKDDISNRTPIIDFNNTEYIVRYVNTSFSDHDVLVILMLNARNDLYYSLISVVLVVLIVLIIMAAVIFWLYLVQRYVQDHALTAEQGKAYHPHQLRKMTVSMGVISVILFFIFALSSQTIINLYIEATSSDKSLDIVMNRLENSEKQDSQNRRNEEAWSVYYTEKIAELLEMDPDLRTHTFLEEVSNIVGADYIMLYDENGDELVSSNSFVKFSLGTKEDDDTTDFRRLLKGMPTIVHEPTVEKNSERYVQMIGTAVPFDENNYGALILAINPKNTWQLSDKDELSDFIKMVTPEGNLCVIESPASGKIQYASDQGLVGKTSQDVGLSTETDVSYMFDSFNVNGEHYYGTFEKNDNYHFFYLTETGLIQLNTIPFSVCSALCFTVIFAVIGVFMLAPYKADIYEKTVNIETETQSEMMITEEEENAHPNENGKKNHLFFRLKNHLQNLTPEKQVTAVFEFFLSAVFLILMVLYMFRSSSVINFILFGNWKRGINLLSFSGTILLVLMFLVLVLFNNSLTRVMTNILNPKGLTIWKLLVNLIHYFLFILLLYFIFTYLGFNANVLLASFSAFSLAISLGAKDLVADILAGVFLVFEDNFHVNDIIEIDGYRGRVMEIGLRSTKLIGAGDNIKIFGNQSVKKIVNLSRLNSWYIMQVKVPADQPLEEIEAMLERELPKIGASIPQVINGPIYKGVIAIDGNNNSLSIITECREENFRRVQREVNRAIRLLFQKNGIKIN